MRVKIQSGARPRKQTAIRWAASCFLLSCFLLPVSGFCFSESTPSRNRAGNKLFEQGKYAEAGKAYLEAQVQDPGRPELSYNLGNTLIKQKQYKDAMKWLAQAMQKADRGLQQQAWYNAGNALYEMGSFQDAIQSYIQALRLNPGDRDAKHNLELAWRKLDQQKQNQSKDKEQNQGDNKPDNQNQQGAGNQPKPKPDQEKGQGDQEKQDRNQPANPQSTQADQQNGNFSKERALQILDALQNQELADQKKLLERAVRRKATGKDW
jgi:Ca-activated chloride channel family protein